MGLSSKNVYEAVRKLAKEKDFDRWEFDRYAIVDDKIYTYKNNELVSILPLDILDFENSDGPDSSSSIH